MMHNESMNDQPPQFGPIGTDSDWTSQGWNDESDPMTAAPELSVLISIRLDSESARQVAQAARQAGIGRSEFVRRAAVRAAADLIDRAPDDATRADDSGPLASGV
jgi:hypothetical protein